MDGCQRPARLQCGGCRPVARRGRARSLGGRSPGLRGLPARMHVGAPGAEGARLAVERPATITALKSFLTSLEGSAASLDRVSVCDAADCFFVLFLAYLLGAGSIGLALPARGTRSIGEKNSPPSCILFYLASRDALTCGCSIFALGSGGF